MSKNVLVSFNGNKQIDTEIKLTGSKSECNRALIISALSKGEVSVQNLSDAADTVLLVKSLKSIVENQKIDSTLPTNDSRLIDIGPAGTAMRFLTAFLAIQEGSFTLTGTERMKQRPIGILVEALKSIGAEIKHLENDGFPPLHISGPLKQTTAKVKIKGDISSQYISALLMIAPRLPLGLVLEIEGELTSKPYVEMTLAMLAQVGIRNDWYENTITIENQSFNTAKLYVEPDWSAASYWYAIAALSDEASIFLPGLNGYSLQGDSKITEIMANF